MAPPLSLPTKPLARKRLGLTEIDAVVSAKLGTTRTPGNAQPACFNRQVAMYLAARIGGWSTTEIGRFYNGRDHSTVCYGMQRIEALRESNPEVDAVVTQLKQQLANAGADPRIENDCRESDVGCPGMRLEEVADRIAQRITTIVFVTSCQPVETKRWNSPGSIWNSVAASNRLGRRSVEPDTYITDLDGEILVSREGMNEKVRVGTVSAHSVHLGEADEDGVPWFDVLDARSGDTAMYIDLFEVGGSCYSDWVNPLLNRLEVTF